MLNRMCQFGDHLVDPADPEVFHEITAWVSGPKKDGGVLRKLTARVACKECIGALREGHAPGEGDLFTLIPKEAGVNQTTRAYALGWKHGFLGHGQDPQLVRNHEYAVGFVSGRELSGHLDGYFFFEDTP